jgi:hypothetical protein
MIGKNTSSSKWGSMACARATQHTPQVSTHLKVLHAATLCGDPASHGSMRSHKRGARGFQHCLNDKQLPWDTSSCMEGVTAGLVVIPAVSAVVNQLLSGLRG